MIQELTRLLRHSHPALIIFLEVIGGILLSLFSLALFIDLTDEVMERGTVYLDTIVSQAVYAIRNPALTSIMFGISYLGSGTILLAASMVLIVLVWRQHRREAILLSFLIGMGIVLNVMLKYLVQRPRPILSPLVHVSSYSYPSGHAMNAFVFYATLAYLVYHFTRDKRLSLAASGLALMLIVLIGFSRVYLGVHYPSDVIGGWIAGFCWFVTVIALQRTLHFFHLFKERGPCP